MSKDFWGTSDAPIAIAHRGGAGAYNLSRFRRENTSKVFREAQKLGYDYLELDVITTADKKVIVLHVTTDRFEAMLHKPSAPSAKKMQSYTHHELTTKLGRQIPTLSGIFKDFPDTKFLIDSKSDEVVEPLAQEIIRAKAYERVFLNSFYLHRIKKLQRLLGDRVIYGLIIGRYPRLLNRKLWGLIHGKYTKSGLAAIVLPYQFMDTRLLNLIHGEDMRVIVWTANNRLTIEHAINLGVDGIQTDNTELLKEVLKEKNSAL